MPHAEPPVTVLFVPDSRVLREKLVLHQKTCPRITFIFPEETGTDTVDLCVLPASKIEQFSQEHSHLLQAVPLFCYGPRRLIKAAYIMGCTEYIKEPWDLDELTLRILHWLPSKRIHLPWGTLRLHTSFIVSEAQKTSIPITPKESLLLKALHLHQGEVVNRKTLTELLATGSNPDSRALDMQISLLRKAIRRALDAEGKPNPIRSVRGEGYMLVENC